MLIDLSVCVCVQSVLSLHTHSTHPQKYFIFAPDSHIELISRFAHTQQQITAYTEKRIERALIEERVVWLYTRWQVGWAYNIFVAKSSTSKSVLFAKSVILCDIYFWCCPWSSDTTTRPKVSFGQTRINGIWSFPGNSYITFTLWLAQSEIVRGTITVLQHCCVCSHKPHTSQTLFTNTPNVCPRI